MLPSVAGTIQVQLLRMRAWRELNSGITNRNSRASPTACRPSVTSNNTISNGFGHVVFLNRKLNTALRTPITSGNEKDSAIHQYQRIRDPSGIVADSDVPLGRFAENENDPHGFWLRTSAR